MADNIDDQSFGNFSIQDTMEMGMGNQQLLTDLLGSDTSTTNPDDIKDIETPDTKTTPNASKKKEADKKDDSKEEPSKSIENFLLGNDEDEESDEETESDSNKTKDTKPTDNQEDTEGGEEPNQFTALSKDLFKLGVFSNEDDTEEEPITSPEQFLERFNTEKKKGSIEMVDNFLGQFGDDYKNAFDAIFVKGVDPKEYFGAYNQIQSFSEMDLTQESNQISIIKKALDNQGYDAEDIDTEVERLKNYGDLESVATKHHKVLIKKEAAKLQELEQQKEQQLKQQQAYKQQYTQNISNVLQEKLKGKEFDGIPLNPKLAGELQDFLVTDKYKTPTGELLTDFDKTILELKRPENHELKVKVGLLLKILEKDPTLSTIQKSGVSKKSNELFGEVARQAQKSVGKSGTSKSQQSSSWFQ